MRHKTKSANNLCGFSLDTDDTSFIFFAPILTFKFTSHLALSFQINRCFAILSSEMANDDCVLLMKEIEP